MFEMRWLRKYVLFPCLSVKKENKSISQFMTHQIFLEDMLGDDPLSVTINIHHLS